MRTNHRIHLRGLEFGLLSNLGESTTCGARTSWLPQQEPLLEIQQLRSRNLNCECDEITMKSLYREIALVQTSTIPSKVLNDEAWAHHGCTTIAKNIGMPRCIRSRLDHDKKAQITNHNNIRDTALATHTSTCTCANWTRQNC